MSLPDRLSSLSSAERGPTELRRDSDGFDNPGSFTAGGAGLVQRCVIIQKDERGYGLTVSGDNPVYVASVKPEGAAAKAGVQKDDRIVKVNGTLVTSKNHIEVVKLIKSGSYVALTLMGRPNSATSPGGNQPGSSPFPSRPPSTSSNRDSTLITAPRPVDPNKDKELLQQKVHMTQVMFEQAKEDFEKHQRQYVRTPSERLHAQLLEKERTVKTLENQLKQLTGAEDPTTPSFTQGSQRFDVDSDFSSLSSKTTSYPSEGSMSDSPHTSPSISPTPVHPDNHIDDLSKGGDSGVEDLPMQPEIITIDDEDVNSDDEPHLGIPRQWSGQRPVSPFLNKLQTAETCDTGPFSDIRLLEKKPAHMGVFLHYLLSNSDPNALFFYIVTSTYKESGGNSKDLRKWGYEIFSTFLAPCAPLHIDVGETLVAQVNEQLSAGPGKSENENVLRSMFDGCRAALSNEISDQLADFRNKRDLGLGNIFGVHELKENMDKGKEIKMIEKYLMPHLTHCTQVTPQEEKETGRKLSDRDLAVSWALATFLRQVGVSKTSSSGNILERMQSFIMKDKRGFKIPGSRSTKAKTVKGHQFNLNHFLVPTFCAKCEGLIWGVGYQGFICQSCEMGIHKQCVEDVQEACSGKKRGKRASGLIPVLSTRKPSNPNQQAGQPFSSVAEALGQASLGIQGETRSPPADATGPFTTQPFRSRTDEDELASVPKEHSVKSIVDRYQELNSPTGPGPGEGEITTKQERKGSTDLSRSESLKGKGDKTERPPRRAKSDVDSNDMFKAISQQSGSSSTSSLSNRSVESPSASTDNVNDALAGSRTQQDDSDLEVDELPPLKQVLGEDVCKKLKPKEKKRQEVINELFHTERAHLRNLKVLDFLFNQHMQAEGGVLRELARNLFPNIEEIITLHSDLNTKMKERRNQNAVVGDVGDLLLGRFDGEEGDRFRKACAEYCRNQSYALDALKRHRRKDQRIAQFLGETEADKLCRKLELKDQVPCEMQRLTKYPMLIENLMKYTQSPSSDEYKNLETALERSKKILAYVNQAVRECENYHKLKEWQKKLDKRAIDNSSDPFLKELDLTKHKLVHDGFLVWRLRSHRLIELQVLLLEDILVLLQRVDDRLVLKCQSTNQQSIGNDYKYTHSPVLKLQNLLARNVATDKKAFFVINTSDTGPQIYELVAPTQDARKTWCKLINEKAEEHKRGMTMNNSHMGRVTKSTPSPQPDEITMVRSRIMRKSQEPSPPPADEGQAAAPAFIPPEHENVENVGSLATADYQPELIQPDQINVSGAVTAHAQPVLSPLERLRRNDQVIDQALMEKEQIVAEMLHLSLSEYQHLAQRAHNVGNLEEEEEEYDEQSLVVSCIQSNNRLIQLIASRASSLAGSGSGSDPSSGSGSGSSTAQPSSLPSENESESSRLRQQQELLAQGAAGQNVNIPIPMDQLRGMANEMNSILSNLLHVMGTRGAERQSLRQELAAAQEQLEMLKAIQRQMMEQQQQPPSTPQSRPQSFVSVASSMSEATDGDNTEDDGTRSLLNVAVEQEQITEMEEAVKPLVTGVLPQETTAGPTPDEDSDDTSDMYPENLPLPDDSSITADTAYTTSVAMETREEEDGGGSSVDAVESEECGEPMTTDLDEGGEGEDGRSTPTPSPTPMGTVEEEDGREEEEEGDTDSIITISTDGTLVGSEDGHPLKAVTEEQQQEGGLPLDNNNTSSQDSELTNPIDV